MSKFDVLFVAHLIGDYLFQTNWMAVNKSKKWLPLVVHSLLYTFVISIAAILSFGELPIWSIALVFAVHLLLDSRIFVHWWVKNVMRTTGKEAGWLGIMVDQSFHMIVLAIVAYV